VNAFSLQTSRAGRVVVAALAAIVLAAGLSVWTSGKAQAFDGSDFRPGFIISDSKFWDYKSMTKSEIQLFLDYKGRDCETNCLKDFIGTTLSQDANPDRCPRALTGKQNISAAQIIYDVSQACRINPQTLMVIMQKETSLLTMDGPGDWRYQRAMGYACPDSRPGCDSAYSGFFAQIYYGAGQLNWYSNPKSIFTWRPIGEVSNILYHPDSSRDCGSSPVKIENRATAALYYYTPYQPNKAALDNLYGTGNSCSSYGNRNFWRLFYDWFGRPTAESSTPAPKLCIPSEDYPFCDVPTGHRFFDEIGWLAETGATTGYEDGSFRPEINVSREAMAAYIYRLSGSPEFTPPAEPSFGDVPTSHPFFAEIEWLAAEGIAEGFEDGTFAPRTAIARQAFAAFLLRIDGDEEFVAPEEPSFPDVKLASEFFTAVEWLAHEGVTTGFDDGKFYPANPVTRQAMAAFLFRYYGVEEA
jgi:hypothetical protein